MKRSDNPLVFGGPFGKLKPVFRTCLKRTCSILAFAMAAAVAAAQGVSPVDVANLHEDVRGLSERVADLSLRVEQLEHQNAELRARLKAPAPDAVTAAQLNAAIADLNAAIAASVAASKHETLEVVAHQMEKLARQTNAALDSIARSGASVRVAPVPAPVPPASTSAGAVASAGAAAGAAGAAPISPVDGASAKPGIKYTVQRGDTLDGIAKKTGAKAADIIAANKLTDPSRIRVGQSLFVPGGK